MPFSRGIYYTQDSSDNWKLAKCHTKSSKDRWDHSKPHIGGFSQMTPQEVLDMLERLGIKREVRTLQRYAKMELVPLPSIINLGRGTGKIVDHPDSTPYEFYGSIYLKQFGKATNDEIKEARRIALIIERELEEDSSLLEWSREYINNHGKDYFKNHSSINFKLGENYYGEGDFSDEVRLAFKKRLNEKTQNNKIAKLAIEWWYLSRKGEGKAKEIIEKAIIEEQR